MPDATFVIDRDGKVIAWNKAIEALTRVTAGDILGKSEYEYAIPFYGERRPILVDLVLRSDPKWEQKYTNLRREGDTLTGETYLPLWGKGAHLLCRAAILRDGSGAVMGAIEQIHDFTEHKQVEEALKFRNIYLSTLQETSLDGILVVNDEGKMTYFNQQFVRMWGIPPEVVKSRSDEQALQSVIDKLAQPQEFIERVTYLYQHREEKSHEEFALKDGRIFDRYSSPMFGEDGKYYGRVWYFRDITERRRGEEALRLSQARLQLQMDRMPIGCILWTPEFRVASWNPAAERIFGFAAADVFGKQPYGLIVPEGARRQVEAVWSRLLEGDASAHSVNENTTRDAARSSANGPTRLSKKRTAPSSACCPWFTTSRNTGGWRWRSRTASSASAASWNQPRRDSG